MYSEVDAQAPGYNFISLFYPTLLYAEKWPEVSFPLSNNLAQVHEMFSSLISDFQQPPLTAFRGSGGPLFSRASRESNSLLHLQGCRVHNNEKIIFANNKEPIIRKHQLM